jgi:hypothetical protein
LPPPPHAVNAVASIVAAVSVTGNLRKRSMCPETPYVRDSGVNVTEVTLTDRVVEWPS